MIGSYRFEAGAYFTVFFTINFFAQNFCFLNRMYPNKNRFLHFMDK